jgi:HK97 gp10 family phage protein
MEIAQNVVKNHAQANHRAAPPPGMGHPDNRYYDRTARLTNSIRPEKVNAKRDIITGNVLAGVPGLVEYAAAVEFGTSRSRAYPYLGPALTQNEKKILLIFSKAVKQIIK